MFRAFLFLAGCYVVARLLVVLALGDVFVYGEENEKAFVALAVRAGADVPWTHLPYHPYEGGGFAASLVKAAFVPVLGATPWMQKTAAILWGLAVLAVTMRLAGRHGVPAASGDAAPARFSTAAALFAGALWVLAPVSLFKGSLVHLGIHVEALLFIGLVLHLGLEAAAVPREERVPARTLVALGLASGLGSWFSYQTPLAVLAVIVLLAVRRWRTIFRPSLMAATVLGLSPWLAMAAAHGAGVFDLHGDAVGGGSVRAFFETLHVAATETFVGPAFAVGFAATVAGIVYELPTGRRLRALFVVGGFVDLWAVLAIVTGLAAGATPSHWFHYQRFAPPIWALLVILAIAVGPALGAVGAARGRASSKVARAGAAIVLGIGGVALARMVDEGELTQFRAHAARLADVRAVEARSALVKLLPRVPADGPTGEAGLHAALAYAPVVADADPGPWRELLATDLVSAAAYLVFLGALDGPHDPDVLVRGLRAAVPADVRPAAFARGIGPLLFARAAAEPGLRAQLDDGSFSELEAEALGRFGGWFGARRPEVVADVQAVSGTPRGPAYLRGLGARVFRTGVMQAYWGEGYVYRPERLLPVVLDLASTAGATEAGRAALEAGFVAEAEAFGFGAPVSWVR